MTALARRVTSSPSTLLLAGLWIVLTLLLASLIGLAIMLLVQINVFSGKALTNDQLKSVWAFLGVALGAAVTLIGTLLTEQHNRRTEKRLKIDTVAKTLELITDDSGGSLARARIGGAVATMMELEGSAVAIRILGDLWMADAVDSETAVWLINRVLTESKKPDELEAAADLLVNNVRKLVPAKNDANQDYDNWPAVLRESWPTHLPPDARNSLSQMLVKVLLVREPEYWQDRERWPINLMYKALDDPVERNANAFVLFKLFSLGILEAFNQQPSAKQHEQILDGSSNFHPFPWFVRFVEQIEFWAAGEDVSDMAAASFGSSVPPMGVDAPPTKSAVRAVSGSAQV